MESPLLFVLCRTSAEVLYELVYLWPSGLNRFWNDFVPQMFTLDSEPECKLMSVVGDVSVPSHEFPFHLFFYCCFSICFPFYFFPMYFLFFSLLFAENRNSSCSPTGCLWFQRPCILVLPVPRALSGLSSELLSCAWYVGSYAEFSQKHKESLNYTNSDSVINNVKCFCFPLKQNLTMQWVLWNWDTR